MRQFFSFVLHVTAAIWIVMIFIPVLYKLFMVKYTSGFGLIFKKVAEFLGDKINHFLIHLTSMWFYAKSIVHTS